MNETSILLHKTLLRAAKAAIAAWEEWLKSHIKGSVGDFNPQK